MSSLVDVLRFLFCFSRRLGRSPWLPLLWLALYIGNLISISWIVQTISDLCNFHRILVEQITESVEVVWKLATSIKLIFDEPFCVGCLGLFKLLDLGQDGFSLPEFGNQLAKIGLLSVREAVNDAINGCVRVNLVSTDLSGFRFDFFSESIQFIWIKLCVGQVTSDRFQQAPCSFVGKPRVHQLLRCQRG